MSSSLKPNCSNEEDIKHNFQCIREASILYGIQDSLEVEDFIDPCNIKMLLFALHLFHTLPNYIPQQTILFSCFLHESVTKDVMLTNSTAKSSTYLVYLEAHKNFKVKNDIIKLDPGKSVNVSITFQASLSRQLTGRIIFRNRKNGHYKSGALVFELKSHVLGRFSLFTHQVPDVKYDFFLINLFFFSIYFSFFSKNILIFYNWINMKII